MASWVTQDKLPSSFENVLHSYFPQVVIRSNIQNVEDCQKWISEFSILTNTQWNGRTHRNEGQRSIFSKLFVCHRSQYHKRPNKLSQGKITNCLARIFMQIKLNTKSTRCKDPFIKKGLIGVIKITNNHDHSLDISEEGRFFSTKEFEEPFVERFKDGMGVVETLKYQQTLLVLDESVTDEDMSNRRINPPSHVLNYMRSRHQKPKNTCWRPTVELIENLKGKTDALEEKGTTIRFSEEPFALVIMTPMMKKAQKLKSSAEAVFVDSSPSGDTDKHCVTFMFCSCAAGAIPLAIVITKGETAEAFAKGFELLKTSFEESFCEKDGPSAFMVGELETEETKALSLVWPESEIHLCAFRVSQTVWQQLWFAKHNEIPKEHRVTLMNSFQDVLYTRTPAEAEMAYSTAFSLASSKVSGYHKWLKYIQELWEKKESWCLGFRKEEARKHNENEFFEVSFKIYKELLLSRLKAHNVLTLLEFASSHLEKHYRSKMRDFANVGCPMLFLVSLKIKDPRVTHKDTVEEVDGSSYLVKTKFEVLTVHTRSSCCSCRIRLQRRYCEHQYLVLESFPAVSRNFPSLKPEDKDEILALAEEYQPPQPPVLKVEEPFSPESVVIQDVMSLASEVSSSSTDSANPPIQPAVPSLASEVSSSDSANPPIQPAVPTQRFGYYLMTVPATPAASLSPQLEEERRKYLLMQIKMKISEKDNKYGSSIQDLEAMLKNLTSVNSQADWQAFLRGTASNSSGLFLNSSGFLQHLPIQRAPTPIVVPSGATLRRIEPAILPSLNGPPSKKPKTSP